VKSEYLRKQVVIAVPKLMLNYSLSRWVKPIGKTLENGYCGGMSMDHYFTSNPSSPLRLTEHSLTLRGHTVGIRSASGTFSPGSLDTGTAQLLKYAPKPPATGTFVDIGCGWGPLTIALALESPESTVWGIDVNDRALMATKANADSLELSHVHTFLPEAFPEGLSIDLIWSNPPSELEKKHFTASSPRGCQSLPQRRSLVGGGKETRGR